MGSLLEEMAKAEATKVGISSESTSVLGKYVNDVRMWSLRLNRKQFITNRINCITRFIKDGK
jgi:hypothetical protein